MKATIMSRQHNKITVKEHFVYIFRFMPNLHLLVREQHYFTLVMELGTKILTCWSFFIQDQIYAILLLLRDLNFKRGTTLKHKIKL